MITERFKEMFEKIYAYAESMEAPAMEGTSCKYRSANGPCLVGYVISDEEAEAAKDMGVYRAVKDGLFPSLSWMNNEELDFLCQVQNAHDSLYIDYQRWNGGMMESLEFIKVQIYG